MLMDTNGNTKKLLIKDLSSRLPYGVKFLRESWNFETDQELSVIEVLEAIDKDGYINNTKVYKVEDIKPYLFPLSSMTDKDLIEFLQIKGMNLNSDELKTFRRGTTVIVSTLPSYSRHIDWLNKNHFDYRNLIDKNLAIDCTNLNIY